MTLQILEGGGEPRFRLTHVAQDAAHETTGVVGVVSHLAIAIHVDGERGESELRQHVGPPAHVVVETPPLVDDHDTGAPGIAVLVIGQIGSKLGAIGLETHRFGVHA